MRSDKSDLFLIKTDHAISVASSTIRSQYLFPAILGCGKYEMSIKIRSPGTVLRTCVAFEIGAWWILAREQATQLSRVPVSWIP